MFVCNEDVATEGMCTVGDHLEYTKHIYEECYCRSKYQGHGQVITPDIIYRMSLLCLPLVPASGTALLIRTELLTYCKHWYILDIWTILVFSYHPFRIYNTYRELDTYFKFCRVLWWLGAEKFTHNHPKHSLYITWAIIIWSSQYC